VGLLYKNLTVGYLPKIEKRLILKLYCLVIKRGIKKICKDKWVDIK